MSPDDEPESDDPRAGHDAVDSVGAHDGEDADSPADADERPSHDELRVKDLVGRSREELEEQLDPATMAELASWFLRPSMSEQRERAVPDDVQRGPDAAQLDAFQRLAEMLGETDDIDLAVRERALAAIDPRMCQLLERHEQAADRVLPVRVEPRQVVDETLLPARVRALLVADGEELPALGEPRTLQPSPDVADFLKDNAPQAVLRDLNRPVQEFERRLEPAFPPPSPEEDTTFAIRDALRWRPEKVPPHERPPDARHAWLSLLRGSWPELVAGAKVIRQAEIQAADEQLQRDAEAGIHWGF